MAIASSDRSLYTFEKPASPGFHDLPGLTRCECGNARRDPKHSSCRTLKGVGSTRCSYDNRLMDLLNSQMTEHENSGSEALRRLAHFDPTCTDEYGHQALDYLVLDALASIGELSATPSQVAEIIRAVYRLEFELAEIREAARHLAGSGLVDIEPHEQHEPLHLTIRAKAAERIRTNLMYVQRLEDDVLRAWKGELESKYSDYQVIVNGVDRLVDALKIFMAEMFYRHGVECVALLYPDAKRTRAWLQDESHNVLDALPQDDTFLGTVARYEIPTFFESQDGARAEYVTSLLNSSFFWHLLQVDEDCSRLLRDVVHGQQLFLDNNVVYSLVGFHGADMLASTHRMLELAVELGYSLRVTTKTIDEFQASLQYQMRKLQSRPPVPTELARIALHELGTRSFLTAYWQELVSYGTSVEDFIAEKSHLERVFDGLGVRIHDEWRAEIEQSPELLTEMRTLRSVSPPSISDQVLEHDAFHRILIGRTRGTTAYHFSEAKAWFLTHDRKLPHYSQVARHGGTQLPFCLTTDQWVQLNRPLLTRTHTSDELRDSFHTLITKPFLRSMLPPFRMDEAYNRVLGRLARHKHMTPKLALDIVTRKQFMFRIACTDEANIPELEKDIDSELVALAEQYQREKLETTTELAAAKGEASQLRDSLTDVRSQLRRWGIGAVLLLITSLVLWFHHKILGSSLLHSHRNGLLLAVAAELFLLAVLLNIPLRRHWAVWLPALFSIAALAIGLIAN